MKVVFEPSDSSGATKMEVPEKTPPTYADLGIDKGLIKEMPKNEGGGDKKSKQYKESKITPTKTEGVILPHTYSEGTKGQPFGRGFTGGTKMEPPINKGKSETLPHTYNENYA